MIEFTIIGAPVPKGRPRFVIRGRGPNAHVHTYTPPETEAAERAFALQSAKYRPRYPLHGPLCVDLIFVVPAPARFDADRSRIWPHVKSDLDNYTKLVLDALNGIFWHDDGQVCAGESFKVYAGTPRTFVRIRHLTQEDHNRVLEMLGEPVAQASLIGG